MPHPSPDITREVTVFVSSPGDVMAERQRLQRVAERLNGRFAGVVRFRCVRWEEHFYRSHATFQDQIEHAAACDIVVSVFWTRLGTALPPEFGERLPDGRPYPSGTAYEVLSALEAARHTSVPDVYVFRKTQRPLYPDPDDEADAQLFELQLKRLRAFWEEWFRNRAGQFRAAFNSFGTTDEFETQIEKLLLAWVADKGILGRSVRWRIDERGSPFRGLLPFEAGYSEVFFGRTVEIERGRERLVDAVGRGVPFLLVLGASGSGKSSLVRAGVIPRLMLPGAIDGVDVWRAAQVTLGRGDADPLRNLATTLLGSEALPELAGVPNATADGIAGQLSQGGETAAGVVRWALEHIADEARVRDGYDRPVVARLILLVDQFESLFAGSVPPDRRRAFVLVLDGLVRSGLVWAIATLRSTEYTLLQADPTLLKLKEDGATLDLVPPDAVALAETIRGPAAAAGLAFERDATSGRTLDDVLRADAGGADALALLQFTLEHLFQARQERNGVPTLTFDAYSALGGIEGAIAAEAERAVSGLPARTLAQLPWLLRHLVGATRRRGDAGATLRDMVLEEHELALHPGAAELIDALVAARVLILDVGDQEGPRRARLAHEAVLRGWKRARDFVESNARYYRQYGELQAVMESWLADNRSKDHLLRGTPLAQAEDLVQDYGAELPRDMREFVRVSRRAADRGRRIAYGVAAGMGVLFLMAVGGAGYAWYQRAVAEKNFTMATANESRALTALSAIALANSEPLDALKLALAAWPRTADETTRPMLRSTLDALSAAILAPRLAAPDLQDIVALSLVGSRAVERKAEGALQFRDALTGQPVGESQHDADVKEAHFSGDGRRLATKAGNRTVRLWDATSGVPVGSAALDHTGVLDFVFSRDSMHLATWSQDGTARLWDATSGTAVGKPLTHAKAEELRFSGDSQRLATVASAHTVQLWDATSGAAVGEPLKHPGLRNLTFSHDGQRLATVGRDGTVQLWDATSATPVGNPLVAKSAPDIMFLGKGQRLATPSGDGTIRLWDTARGAAVGETLAQAKLISIVESRDGERLVTRSEDHTVRLWNATNGAAIGGPLQHHGIGGAMFSADSKRLATWSKLDSTVQVWDATSGAAVGQLLEHVSWPFEFSDDGRRLATVAGDGTMQLWDTTSGIAVSQPLKRAGTPFRFSADGKRLTTWRKSFGGKMRQWDVTDGAPAGEPLRHVGVGDYRYSSVQVSGNGKRVVTVSEDGTAWLWDAGDDAATGAPLEHAEVVIAVFSGDSKRLATVSRDGTARLWDATNGTAVGEPLQDISFRIRFSDDGQRLAAQFKYDTLQLWDATSGAAIGRPLKHYGVEAFLFSADSKRLATRSEDTIRLWDARDGTEMTEPLKHVGLKVIAFSDDGQRLATGAKDGTLRLWDVASGAEAGKPLRHTDVEAVTFSADGKRLAAGSTDGWVRLWEIASGASVGEPLKHFGVKAIRFSRDGKRLATVDSDGPVRLWDVSSARLIATLPAQATLDTAKPFLDSTEPSAVILFPVKDHVLRVWWRNPIGEHLLSIACAHLPTPARETQSLEKYGIRISRPLCEVVPPAPDWSHIDRDAPASK